MRELAESNLEINESMKRGKLIDDDYCMKLLEDQIDSVKPFNGLLFDGNPKNLKQAKKV